MAAGPSNPLATMKLLFIKYQYDNKQGAKIYKDDMDRYYVKIEDRPSEFKDLVPMSYSGARYLDDKGIMYLVVLNPNIVDKWGLMGMKDKVDEEPEEKAPTMSFPDARLRRENETLRVNTDNVYVGLYKHNNGEQDLYYRCKEPYVGELTEQKRFYVFTYTEGSKMKIVAYEKYERRYATIDKKELEGYAYFGAPLHQYYVTPSPQRPAPTNVMPDPMATGFPNFTGVEDVETWLQDYGLFVWESRLTREEDAVQVFSLLVRGQAKKWNVRDKVKGNGPVTYTKAVNLTRGQTKKILKNRQARQGLSNAMVPRSVDAVEVKPKLVQREVPMQEEPRVLWLQIDGMVSMLKMPDREAPIIEEQVVAHRVEDAPASSGKVQSFAVESKANLASKGEQSSAIEDNSLSPLAKDEAKEQVIEEHATKADMQEVLIDLEGPVDEEGLDDVGVEFEGDVTESVDPMIEEPMPEVCSMVVDGGDSQVVSKLSKGKYAFRSRISNNQIHQIGLQKLEEKGSKP
ncbi:hypothetical protein L7F22_001151 [Adiantum nelumboides]|nr:hypothetical protein [Adiantum nelumboides]